MTQTDLAADDRRPAARVVRRLSGPAALRALGSSIARLLGWTPSSYLVLSLFAAAVSVVGVLWWPLLRANVLFYDWSQPLWPQVWLYTDWLLLGIFGLMTLLIMAGADIATDARIAVVGLAGGFVIESWGTQTRLWTYFTHERPPLWILPAWSIASLSIDRLYRFLNRLCSTEIAKLASSRLDPFQVSYWIVFPCFYLLMLRFVWPTVDRPMTIGALGLTAFFILTSADRRAAVLTFGAGAGLGYLLELWGTTRQCWTYHTHETPPLFAVLAHGMAAVAFLRAGLVVEITRRGRCRKPRE